MAAELLLGLILAASLQAAPAPLPALRVGADMEAGAPYVFPDPADPTRLIGFEADLAQGLAAEMGRTLVFVQNQWDGLIPGLQTDRYDLVINGLEITPDRAAEIEFSRPYYLTFEQLTVRRDSPELSGLSDLRGMAVGTLKFSLAERMLEAAGGVKVKSYEDEVNIYADLLHARTDAVLLDSPIAIYYALPNPLLKPTGPPIGRLEYGVGMRKGDESLKMAVDRALSKMSADGSLRKILEDWKLWNPLMAESLGDATPSPPDHPAYDRFLKTASQREGGWRARLARYAGFLPLLGKGACVTLALSLAAMTLAVVLGLTLCLARLYGPWPLALSAWVFVEVMRGTPLLIQLYLIYYGLPNLGIKFEAWTAAVLGLGLNYAAYESENYRAGILSIPVQQMESALSLGMNRAQALRHVILPQALRTALLPTTNDFVSLLKDSSLVSVITMVELTKQYGQLASTYYDYLGLGVVTALLYFLMGLPFVRLSRWLEKRLAHDQAPKKNAADPAAGDGARTTASRN